MMQMIGSWISGTDKAACTAERGMCSACGSLHWGKKLACFQKRTGYKEHRGEQVQGPSFYISNGPKFAFRCCEPRHVLCLLMWASMQGNLEKTILREDSWP